MLHSRSNKIRIKYLWLTVIKIHLMSSCSEKMDQSLFATKICKHSKGYLHIIQAIHFWKNYYPHHFSDLQVPSIFVLLRPAPPCKCFPHTSRIKIGKSKKFGMLGYLGPYILGIIPTKVLGAPSFFIELTKIEKPIVHADPQKCFKMLLIF